MGKGRKAAPPARRGGTTALLVAALVALVAGAAWLASGGDERSSASAPADLAAQGSRVVPAVARRETRPTLDPARFVGKVALAHRVAREIPDVLDQLYCYCECDKHVGHKSLLSCYTDGHAAT